MTSSKPKAIAVDMDGTLVDVSGLRHYVEGKDKNYDAFHKASVLCPPIQWVIDEAKRWHDSGAEVIVVTARQKKYRGVTYDWLLKHGVIYNHLMMRPNGDMRPDYEVKSEILEFLQRSYDIIHAYDDNPSTYPLWIEHSIPTTVIPGWNYERV